MTKESPRVTKWESDKLSHFLQEARQRQLVTITNSAAAFDILRDIDDSFSKIISEASALQPNNRPRHLLLGRSHAAYRAACGTSLAGQAPETFALLRSCLECAAYALLSHRTPELEVVWIRRHRDAKAFSEMKSEFTANKAKKAVEVADLGLANLYDELYNDTIDFGGHPNPKGILMSRANDGSPVYFHEEELVLNHCLRAAARTGLCSLFVFNYVFEPQFSKLKIKEALKKIWDRCHI